MANIGIEHCVYCRLYDDCPRKYYITCVCDKYVDVRNNKFPYINNDEDICE